MFAPLTISRPPSEELFSPFGLQIHQAISTIPAPPTTTTAAHLRPAPNRHPTSRNTTSTSGTTSTTSQPHHNPHLHWVTIHDASHSRAKTNIARFGATWLRSAGCPKTLQAQEDEAAERAEQEEQERRQRGLAEAVAAQEAEERRRRLTGGVGGDGAMEDVVVLGHEGQAGDVGEGGDGLGMERDLDDEVPEQENVDMDEGDEDEAEEEEDDDNADNDDDDDDEEEVEGPSDVVFEEEDEAGNAGMERNLDSDIPEASGEYEHTDTDLEDDETEEVSISQGLDGTSEVDLHSSTLSRQQQSQQRRSAQHQQNLQQPRLQYQQEQRQAPRAGLGTVSAAPRMLGIAMSPGVFTSSPAAGFEGHASELESSVFGPSEAGFASGSPGIGLVWPPGAPRRS